MICVHLSKTRIHTHAHIHTHKDTQKWTSPLAIGNNFANLIKNQRYRKYPVKAEPFRIRKYLPRFQKTYICRVDNGINHINTLNLI